MAKLRDRAQIARKLAAAPTLERIRADRKHARGPVKRFLAQIEKRLFEPDFTVTTARRAARIGDNSASSVFRRYLNVRPADYIERRRLETADRILSLARPEYEGLEVIQVARAVGFLNVTTFSRRYTAWRGKTPSEVMRENGLELDHVTLRLACRGALDHPGGRWVIEFLDRLYPPEENETPEPEIDFQKLLLDGVRYDRWHAGELWQAIRALPPEEQQRHVRKHLFRSPAMFDLLREKSREEGRKDRQRGIQLAELALESLASCGAAFGERGHDLRALGLAWLGNARRLAFDFLGAEADFREAWAEWRTPREKPDALVAADIFLRQGALRISQQSYDEALELVDEALSVFRQKKDEHRQAVALIQRSSAHVYAGNLTDAITDLQQARDFLEKDKAAYLVFTVHKNIGNIYVRAGRNECARENLKLAQEYWPAEKYPIGKYELQWLEGFIKHSEGDLAEADKLYAAARVEFLNAKDPHSVGLLLLHQALLYSQQERYAEVLDTVAQAVPILKSLKLTEETLAVLQLLSEAVSAGELRLSLLKEAQHHLQSDPLFGLS